MISGKHVRRGTTRRLAYSAWYERVGTRVYVTAAVRYGDRLLATADLEAIGRSEADGDEALVAALVARFIDDAPFDFGPTPGRAPASSDESDRSAARRPPSARSEWADVRAGDWGR